MISNDLKIRVYDMQQAMRGQELKHFFEIAGDEF
jgi:hypothetical protein